MAIAVAWLIVICAGVQVAFAPPAVVPDAVAVGEEIVIVASAPVADAPPDALADGAVTATADSAPDALALTDPPPPEKPSANHPVLSAVTMQSEVIIYSTPTHWAIPSTIC